MNTDIAGVGVRDELRYFQTHVKSQVILTAAASGNGGWFSPIAALTVRKPRRIFNRRRVHSSKNCINLRP